MCDRPHPDLDFHAWALDQADRLRGLDADQFRSRHGIDLDQLAEEVGDLAHVERRETARLLTAALQYMIKAALAPTGRGAAEALTLLDDASDRYTASMGPLLDPDQIWGRAVLRARRDLSPDGVPDLPAQSPFRLEELLDQNLNLQALIGRIRGLCPGPGPAP